MRCHSPGCTALIASFIIFTGCPSARRANSEHNEFAVITISNDWIEEGEDEVVVMEEGVIRIAVPLRDEKSIQVYAGRSMKRFALSFTESGRFVEFHAGIRAGHGYAIRCSPCCLLRIDDDDDDPYDFPGEIIFADESGNCPSGMIALYPGLAKDPEGAHRCLPAPRIRFRIADEVLKNGDVIAELGKTLGDEPVNMKEEETAYHPFDIVRSGAPLSVSLFQNGNLLWEGMVIFRVKHYYSFEYDPSTQKPVAIYLDD